MKRKDFLRKMRDRRRGGAIEERQPEVRRAVDWRTLRVDLPAADGAESEPEHTPVGVLYKLPDGVRLEASANCWVRGYRVYETDGGKRAEFQYRPAEEDSDAPPGSTAVAAFESWQPETPKG